jgi:dTDP-glucose 4,6-dehydratase
MKENILITGGAGFIGSNFIRYLLQNNDIGIINLDALTYAGNLENLKEIEKHPNYHFVLGNIKNKELVKFLCTQFNINGIINFAAESHVDRSINNASPFIQSNISGTLALIEVAREIGIKRFLQISTDEVYGSLGTIGKFTELSPYSPNSPYSASKAAGDMLLLAYVHTFGFPGLITRCSNNYGPFQFPEKLIPLMILNALDDIALPVYGNGLNVRDWIHVRDHCSAIWTVFQKGNIGEVYNVGGNCERTNIEIITRLLSTLNKPNTLIRYVKDRPGHDLRYAIDSTKIERELGWKRETDFEQGLDDTIKWYIENRDWADRIRSGEYLKYYNEQYGNINI